MVKDNGLDPQDRPIKLTEQERFQIKCTINTYANDYANHRNGTKFKPNVEDVVNWIENGILSGKSTGELQGN